MIEITNLTKATSDVLRDINELLPQLHMNARDASPQPASLEALAAVVEDDHVVLIVAKDAGRVVGMAMLYILPKLQKKVALVEDVVVDTAYRGQRLGEGIMRKLIDCGRERGVKTLSLTSRPDRVAAHRLYEKLGFRLKETDVFRLEL